MPNTPPASTTSWADSRARAEADPPPRLMGIWPHARKSHAVYHLSKYSALATYVTRRGTDSGTNHESKNEQWLAARMAGPSAGTCSNPSTARRKYHRTRGPRSHLVIR